MTLHASNSWPVWRKALAGLVVGNAISLFIVLIAHGSLWWFVLVPVLMVCAIAIPVKPLPRLPGSNENA